MFSVEECKKASNSVVRLISEILTKSTFNFYLPYNGRSIEIVSKDPNNDTRLYIRIVYIGRGFAVDLSNISFDKSMQHKGYFTAIVNKLKKSRSICEIWVSSVLTPEMHSACKKLNFTVSNDISGYKYIIR